MAGKDRAMKDAAHAAYMKAHKVERKTGQCPMGCGRPVPLGAAPLLAHLNVCRGARRVDSRKGKR